MNISLGNVNFTGNQEKLYANLKTHYGRAEKRSKSDSEIFDCRVRAFNDCGKKKLSRNSIDYILERYGQRAANIAQKLISKGKHRDFVISVLKKMKKAGECYNYRLKLK